MSNKFSKLVRSSATLIASLCVFAALNSSCARVKIKDGEWCADAGGFGAECFHTLSDSERSLEPAAWNTQRYGWVCTSPDNFAQWEAATLKLCNYTGICTWEDVNRIRTFAARVKAVRERYP